MNIQQVATQSKKPKVITDLLIVLSVLLTVLAALPFSLGEVATIIKPEWKPVLTLIGIIASTLLGAIRPYLPSSANPPSNDPK